MECDESRHGMSPISSHISGVAYVGTITHIPDSYSMAHRELSTGREFVLGRVYI
jgi:hypothetical protein